MCRASTGAVNIAQGNALANVGFVNYAERTTFQLGFINATKHLDGLADWPRQLRRERGFPHLAADQFQEILLRAPPTLL
jgi:hypothetical protein